MPLPTPTSTLFPYTTLFRSLPIAARSFAAELRAQTAGLAPSGLANPREERLLRPRHTHNLLRRRSSRGLDRKSTRLNSSHSQISYAVFCLKKKKHISK